MGTDGSLPGSQQIDNVCMYKGWAIKLALAPRPLMIYCASHLAAAMIVTVAAHRSTIITITSEINPVHNHIPYIIIYFYANGFNVRPTVPYKCRSPKWSSLKVLGLK
jgi:hypothetical protein